MTETRSKIGLLVMHYGTPASMEAVLPYYTHIRRGRPPSPEQLQDLIGRYKAIGGPSPLSAVSERQANAILGGLAHAGVSANLYIGTKHAPPFVGDAVLQMAEDGVDQAVGIVLAPHFSSFSIASYRQYALEARDGIRPEMELAFIERWGTLPAFIDGLTARVTKQLEGLDPAETLVIFSAHSLPEKILAAGDPYRDELLETCRLVAERASLPNWKFAFQSASQTGEPWLGPDILEVIREAAPTYRNIVCCTVGFVSDHLEVLFDLGIEAREECAALGLQFRLAETIGVDPPTMNELGKLAAEHLLALK